jgi:hypothetical protein
VERPPGGILILGVHSLCTGSKSGILCGCSPFEEDRTLNCSLSSSRGDREDIKIPATKRTATPERIHDDRGWRCPWPVRDGVTTAVVYGGIRDFLFPAARRKLILVGVLSEVANFVQTWLVVVVLLFLDSVE